jgi:hypothetical protein
MLDVPDRVELEDVVGATQHRGARQTRIARRSSCLSRRSKPSGGDQKQARRVRVCSRSCISRHSHHRRSAPRPFQWLAERRQPCLKKRREPSHMLLSTQRAELRVEKNCLGK